MGKKARTIVSKHKFITTTLLAEYFGLHRNTLPKRFKEFGGVNLYDIFNTLDFILWEYETYGIETKDKDDQQ